MVRRSTLCLFPILVLAAACNRSEKPPADDNGPFLTIERIHNHSLEPGSTVVTWDLTGGGLKEMTAHLLFFKDGKRLPGKEIVCRWDREGLADMHAEMVFLLQEGDAFGNKNKRTANLEIAFKDGEPNLRVIHGKQVFVDGEFAHHGPSGYTTSRRNAHHELEILYQTWFSKDSGGPSGGGLKSLIQNSKGGRAAIAIGLEWKPADKR